MKLTQKQIRDLNNKIDTTDNEELKNSLKNRLEVLTKNITVNK